MADRTKWRISAVYPEYACGSVARLRMHDLAGARLPAREMTALAHKHGCRVLIDGAQAFGAIPVDVKALGCDYYSVNGHKY